MTAHAPLPHDVQLEAAVISALMLDGAAVPAVRASLAPVDFFDGGMAVTYQAILDLAGAGKPTDPVSVCAQLDAAGHLERAGGTDVVFGLAEVVPTASSVRYHAERLREIGQTRAAIRALEDAATALREKAMPLRACLQQTSATLLPLSVGDAQRGFVRMDVGEWHKVLEEFERRAVEAAADRLIGIGTGYPELDQETAGFQPGELIVIGARPKAGKTALTLNITVHALQAGQSVGFVSAEMTRLQLAERVCNIAEGIETRRTARGRLSGDELSRLARTLGAFDGRLHVDDESFPALDDVVARCLDLKARHPDVALIVVDYLQLVSKRDKGQRGDEEIAAVTRGLKGIAKQCGVPVIAPAQVNYKQTDTRANQAPMLADLQGGSAMAQQADFVALLHRPGVFNPDPSLAHRLEISIQAARRTPTWDTALVWDGSTMRITSPRRREEAA